MYEIKNILNSSPSQSENASNKAFYPKTYKSRDFRRRNRINFEKWAGQPIAPLTLGLTSLKNTILSLSAGQRRILELFIYMRSRGLPNYMSQEYIADLLGYSRVHVNRCIQNLAAWGFIDIYNRGRNVSNVYKVANIFMQKHIWEELMSILPILRSFFLLFCLVQPVLNPYPRSFFWASRWYNQKNVTLLIYNEDKLINKNVPDIESTKKYIANLVHLSEKKDEFREQRVKRDKMKQEYIPNGALSSFKNMHKRDVKRQTTNPSHFLKQEAERIAQEVADRKALLESERGTEKEAANNAKAAENLRKLFGI